MSYASCGPVGRVLPVDGVVHGCPPTPTALLNALLALTGRGPAGRGPEKTP